MPESELILVVDGLDESEAIECGECCNEEQRDSLPEKETNKEVRSLKQMHTVIKQAQKAQFLLEAAMDNLVMQLGGHERQDNRHESFANCRLHEGKGKSRKRSNGGSSRSSLVCLVEGSKRKKGRCSRGRSRGQSRSHSRGHSRSHSRGQSRSHSRGHSRSHSRGHSRSRAGGYSRTHLDRCGHHNRKRLMASHRRVLQHSTGGDRALE